MCTGIGLALAGLSAAGSLVKGIGNANAAKTDAQVAALNTETLTKEADVERIFADLSLRRAAADEARTRRQVSSTISGQRAYYGSSNLDPAIGGPLLLAGVTAAQGEVDAGLVRAQGQLDYASGLAKAASTQAGAATSAYDELAAQQRASQELIGGILGAGTALLAAPTSTWAGLAGGGAAATYTIGPPLDIRPPAFQLS